MGRLGGRLPPSVRFSKHYMYAHPWAPFLLLRVRCLPLHDLLLKVLNNTPMLHMRRGLWCSLVFLLEITRILSWAILYAGRAGACGHRLCNRSCWGALRAGCSSANAGAGCCSRVVSTAATECCIREPGMTCFTAAAAAAAAGAAAALATSCVYLDLQRPNYISHIHAHIIRVRLNLK